MRRAAVLLEVRIGEAEIGECTVGTDFAHALRTVRASHRYGDLLRDGATILSKRIKPGKRLRSKTHPEEMLLM